MTKETVELSLCLIAMPGEKKLAERLHAMKGAAGQVMVADMGADADEIKAAEWEGAEILHVPWKGSFGGVKNFCMEQAAGRWVLFLHQNEYFERKDGWNDLHRLLANPNAEGFIVFAPYRNSGVSSPVQSLRLLRNRREYRFEYRSFEKIPDEVLANIADSHLTISKTEPSDDTWEHRTRSALLREELADAPEDGYLAYMAGLERINSGDIEASADFFNKSLPAIGPDTVYAPHVCKCAAWSLLYLGRNDAAEMLNRGIEKYPFYSDLFVIRAELRKISGEYLLAIQDLETCVSVLGSPTSLVPGPEIGSSDVLESLGELYAQTGNEKRALACFRQAYEQSPEKPEYLQAIVGSPAGTDAAETLGNLLKAALKEKEPAQTEILVRGLLQRREFGRLWKQIDGIKTVLGGGDTFSEISLSCRMMLENLSDDCFAAESGSPLSQVYLLKQIQNCWYRGKNREAKKLLDKMDQCADIAEPVKRTYRSVHFLLNGGAYSGDAAAEFETAAQIHNDFLRLGQEKNARTLLPLLLSRADDNQLIRLAEGWAERNRFTQIRTIYDRIADEENKEIFRRRIALTLMLQGHAQTAEKTLLLGGSPLCRELTAILRAEELIRGCLRKIRGMKGNPRVGFVPAVPPDADLYGYYKDLNGGADDSHEKTNAQIHEQIGDFFENKKAWKEALTAYLRALQWEPANFALQQKAVGLARQKHMLLRDARKAVWIAEGSFFENRRDFFRFFYGVILFHKRRYDGALRFFSQQTDGESCRSVFGAYRTGILWQRKAKAPTERDETLPCSAEMLLDVCKSAALLCLDECGGSLQYHDLLDFETEKIQKTTI